MADRFPVLFSEKERRAFPLCPRHVPWAMLAPHDAQAQRNHGGQTLARLAQRGGLDPVEMVSVLDGRDYPDAEVRADAARVKAWAVAELIKRVHLWERKGGPVAALVPGWVWACKVCGMQCAAAAQDGAVPPRVTCSFCKTLHTAEVPAPPVPPNPPEDDPAAPAAGDPPHAQPPDA